MNLDRRGGTYYDPRDHRTTVTQLFDQWIYERRLRPGTIARYENTRDRQLGPLADYPAADVTARDVREWYARLQDGRTWIDRRDEGISESSARTALGHLRAAMQWGVENGTLPRNPVKPPPAPTGDEPAEIPTLAEIRATIDRVRAGGAPVKNPKGKPWKQGPSAVVADMAVTASLTGMRVAEVAGLVADDVDQVAGVIRLRHQLDKRRARRVRLKTASSRRDIPIPAELAPILARRVESAGTGGWLFTNAAGQPMNPGTAATRLKRAAVQVGASRVHFHALRHFYASSLLTAGVPVQDVAAALGHKNATTTLRVYAHVLEGSRDRVADAVSEVIGSGIVEGSAGLRAV